MAKSAKAKKPATPATPVTPPNTSKRAIARLKVREAKHGAECLYCDGSDHNRKQVWLADTNIWSKVGE
jgi:hypothetical protein